MFTSSILRAAPMTAAVCAVAILASGCARNISSNVYKASAVGETSRTFRGVIVAMRNVVVEDKEYLEDNVLGGVAGGVGGGLIGSQFGKGKGNVAATALGAVAGAVGGAFAEKALKSQDATEYTVELNNGELRTVVQGPEPALSVGQSVLLMVSHQGRSRIVADRSGR
ncbi:MAG: glycine zipper 2TM domain-containing protein [Holosporales bacterium]